MTQGSLRTENLWLPLNLYAFYPLSPLGRFINPIFSLHCAVCRDFRILEPGRRTIHASRAR